jgi:hypothetical protein
VKIYVFTSKLEIIKELESTGIDGVLHTYNAFQTNAFVNIAKNISNETKLKHMVAIRPYTISPQLLSQISKTFNELYKKNLLQINLITGWIKENEKDAKGILGPVNDYSTNIERSNYLIEYVDALENLNTEPVDYYVSVTNQFTYAAAIKNNSKMIIDYGHFKDKRYDIKNKKVMISLGAVDSNGEILSQEELLKILLDLESRGIKEVIFTGGEDVMNHVIELVKKYKSVESSIYSMLEYTNSYDLHYSQEKEVK